MKFLTKIEQLFNAFFYKASSRLKEKLPQKLKSKVSTIKKTKPIKSNSKTIKESLQESSKTILNKSKNAYGVVRSIEKGTLSPKKILIIILGLISPFFSKIKIWLVSLKPATLVGVMAMTSLTLLTGIGIYNQGQNIADKVYKDKITKIDNSHLDNKLEKRSKLYKIQQRQFILSDINLPIYIESITSMKTLILDVIVQSSNRYIKQYLLRNEYHIRDRLGKGIEPSIPNFPLTQEGKDILKLKIIDELNQMLKELKIKGHVETIYFQSILAN